MITAAIAERQTLDPLNAGGLLLGVLVVCVALGALAGWAVGSLGIGFAIGAMIGIPLAIFAVYRTYREAF